MTEPGLSEICLYPQFTEGLTDVEFRYESIFGELRVRWEKTADRIEYQVTIPHGMAVRLGREARMQNAEGLWERHPEGTKLYSGKHQLRFDI